MHELFDREMKLLHQEAQYFADAYPGKASQLNLRSLKDRDPYVERLLEGVAFLTASVKARIEDDLPEIVETFIRQNCPTLLQTFPSVFIAQFSADESYPEILFCPKGTEIFSQMVGPDNVECGFRTISDFEYLPLKLINVMTHSDDNSITRIKLSFQIDKHVNLLKAPIKSIPFYIGNTLAFSFTVYHALLTSVKEVFLKLNSEETSSVYLGDQTVVQSCNLNMQDTVFSSSKRGFDGFHLLLDYFGFVDKHLFFKLTGLEKINWLRDQQSFDIEIVLKLHSEFHLGCGDLLLNCVPVVNLYSYLAEPIRITHKKTEYPVIADVSRLDSIQIQSIDSVQSINKEGFLYEYKSLYDHPSENNSPCFIITERYVKDYVKEYHLALKGEVLLDERVSCTLLVNNGHYPRDYFSEFTLQGKSRHIPKTLRVTNVTRPSPPVISPHHKKRLWGFISYLSLNIGTLSDVSALKKCLLMYDWSKRLDNLKRRNAIKAVYVIPINVICRGAIARRIEYHLILDESGFLNLGDMFLFGQVLHRFLSMFISFNLSVKTIIHSYPSDQIFSLEPLVGMQCPI